MQVLDWYSGRLQKPMCTAQLFTCSSVVGSNMWCTAQICQNIDGTRGASNSCVRLIHFAGSPLASLHGACSNQSPSRAPRARPPFSCFAATRAACVSTWLGEARRGAAARARPQTTFGKSHNDHQRERSLPRAARPSNSWCFTCNVK